MAKNIRALKSIVYDNDESYAVQKAFAQLTEEFFRENTLLLIVCLLKLTSEVQRDAPQVVANLRRQKVQLRLIASEYLQKNTDVLDLLSAARYVLESPVHLKKFFDYIQLLNSDVAADDALTLKELIDKAY
ncbi:hypothetical protein Peur_020893 [Populus x canadensis]